MPAEPQLSLAFRRGEARYVLMPEGAVLVCRSGALHVVEETSIVHETPMRVRFTLRQGEAHMADRESVWQLTAIEQAEAARLPPPPSAGERAARHIARAVHHGLRRLVAAAVWGVKSLRTGGAKVG